MKLIKVGEMPVKVSEHKGDIVYPRFVKFKQYAPQFWERMDSPLFAAYYERIMDLFNAGKHAQIIEVLKDYKMAIDNVRQSYDAWMFCFAYISYLEGEDEKTTPDDAELKQKIEKLISAGITAETVKAEVINFMRTSPETFTDHLILHDLISMTTDSNS